MGRSRAEEERLLEQYIEQLWQTLCRYCSERQDDLTASGCPMEVCGDGGWHPAVADPASESVQPLCRGSFVPLILPETECCFRIAGELKRRMRDASFEDVRAEVFPCGTETLPMDVTRELWRGEDRSYPGCCIVFRAVW